MSYLPGDYVTINDNPLSWKILSITGPLALLESGQTGRKRVEAIKNLKPWPSR